MTDSSYATDPQGAAGTSGLEVSVAGATTVTVHSQLELHVECHRWRLPDELLGDRATQIDPSDDRAWGLSGLTSGKVAVGSGTYAVTLDPGTSTVFTNYKATPGTTCSFFATQLAVRA